MQHRILRWMRLIVACCVISTSVTLNHSIRATEIQHRSGFFKRDIHPQATQHVKIPHDPAINFTRKTILTPQTAGAAFFAQPTVITLGPDGRVYAGQLNGYIFALTLDADYNVSAVERIDEIYTTPNYNSDGTPATGINGRQLIGLTFDPTAPLTAPVMYVTHSDPRFGFNGNQDAQSIDIHSGKLTRLVGPDFQNPIREDVIVGLPRSRENHSTTSIVWGPDGWLYIAQGGNTNNGAPSVTFSNEPESYLTAAVLRANINNPAFPVGLDVRTVAGPEDMLPGQFELFATGYRNAYDLVWHSNGMLYLNDNGGNPGFGDTPSAAICPGGAAIDPGFLEDHLHLVEAGAYGGHPNPARAECVLDDGSLYDDPQNPNDGPLAPLPDYTPPLAYYFGGASTNGIVEYKAPTFGGTMVGDLLSTSFSGDHNIRRVTLSADGRSVEHVRTLGAFNQPLDLDTDDQGVIYIAEHGGNAVSLLLPNPPLLGAWAEQPAIPTGRSEVGVVTNESLVYVIAGIINGQRTNLVEAYNPRTETWATHAPLPGNPVDHVGVASYADHMYAVGGLLGWPGPAVPNVFKYHPITDTWTLMPMLPEPRGAVGAAVINGTLYAAGGLVNSAAVTTVTALDLDNSAAGWRTVSGMQVPRDHLVVQAVGDKLYAIGGRDVGIDAVTNVVEIYDPASDSWSYGAPMPTARGGAGSAVLDGKIIVFGGEGGPSGVFPQNEEYDPATNTWRTLEPMDVPRHGIGGATVGSIVFVPGGGPMQGDTFTPYHSAFTLTGFDIDGVCPVPGADPETTDSDDDGYTDADELANGTDRCNQASVPQDFDNDFISDLLDADDDNDTIADTRDQLFLDASNGTTTALPLHFGWNPGDPPLGHVDNSGFTGTQLSGASERVIAQNLSVGGAGGYLGIVATSGTSAGTINTQENALQLGFDATRPFRIETRIAQPFLGREPAGAQAGGLFFGFDQDNYVKLSVGAAVSTTQGLTTGLEFALETHSTLYPNPSGNNVALALPGATIVDLRLEGDPRTASISAWYRLNDQQSWTLLGTISAEQHPSLLRFFRPGLPAGIMTTSHGAFSTIAFVFDYFSLDYIGMETVIALNAGGPTLTLTDTSGVSTTWVNDSAYVTAGNPNGTYSDLDYVGQIDNTNLDDLYITERYGGNQVPLHYSIPITAADLYLVELHFAEIFYGVDGPDGQRSFDVYIEDTLVLDNYNVATAAGGSLRAHIERTMVEVDDGTLDIIFDASDVTQHLDNAKISAIAVRQPPARVRVRQPLFLPYISR